LGGPERGNVECDYEPVAQEQTHIFTATTSTSLELSLLLKQKNLESTTKNFVEMKRTGSTTLPFLWPGPSCRKGHCQKQVYGNNAAYLMGFFGLGVSSSPSGLTSPLSEAM